MKKIVITLLIVFGSMSIQAQEGLTWHKDMNKAIALSKKENKPLFLFFTGSDWCGWCIRLQKEVFKTPEFTEWAKKNVVLVELDFPRKSAQPEAEKTQNAELQQVFAVRGYPTVWFVKAGELNGKTNFEQLGSTGYVAGGPTAWLNVANPIIQKFTPYATTSKSKSKSKSKKK
jgi:protein disulfide-isomerase